MLEGKRRDSSVGIATGCTARFQIPAVYEFYPLHRERYKIINTQLSEGSFKEKEKLVTGPRWAPDTKTDWPTDCRS
jgi:hypothetical protein